MEFELTDECEWNRNPEFPRWDTECDNFITLHNDEQPKDYGFVHCPFCGRIIKWYE
jgi:hypothetical protein